MKKVLNKNLFLFIPLLILNIISLLNMINSKLINSSYNNAFLKQFIWIILGYFFIYIINKFKIFKLLFKYSFYYYLFSIFLLILVLFVGNDINGAKCWLNIFGISFQPSEFVKLTLILYLINIYNKSTIKSFKDEIFLIIKFFVITLIPSILVFLEPDTGAIINYIIILLIMLFSVNLNKWWYISFISIFFIFITLFFITYFFYQDFLINIFGTSIFYRMDRIINFTNGNSYQLENALITIGSSTFFGVGLNKILLYIPEAPTDFIFSFSIGNFGILSALLILLCFLIIIIYFLYLENKNNLNYQKIFIKCYLSILVFHIIYNIGMNLGLLPIMGIPLPFLSYGGTNIIINYIFLGFIISFRKNYKH